jgi:uncharacterized protein
VCFGHGDIRELQIAIRAHANAIEYIPITLISLFTLEYNGAMHWLIHLLGTLFICARLVHATGMLHEKMPCRIYSIYITFAVLLSLAIANLIYLPMYL